MRVLLVEDEPIVALFATEALEEAGCAVVGPAASVAAALALIRQNSIAAALLDLHLGRGESSLPVAHELARRGVPFAFASGYGASALPAEFRDRPLLVKPYGPQALQRVVRSMRQAP